MSVARLVRIGMLTAVFTLTFTSSLAFDEPPNAADQIGEQFQKCSGSVAAQTTLGLQECQRVAISAYAAEEARLYQHVLLTQYVVPRAVIVNAETHWKCYRLSQQATLATLSAIDRGSLLGVDAGAAVIDLYVAHIAELRQL